MMSKNKSQQGLAIYLAVVVLSVVLSVVLGISAILINEIKITREMGNSVTAYYTAETGIERALKLIIADEAVGLQESYSEDLDNGASYTVEIVCPQGGASCPSGIPHDSDCNATNFCVRSRGDFRGVSRAIEVNIYPENP